MMTATHARRAERAVRLTRRPRDWHMAHAAALAQRHGLRGLYSFHVRFADNTDWIHAVGDNATGVTMCRDLGRIENPRHEGHLDTLVFRREDWQQIAGRLMDVTQCGLPHTIVVLALTQYGLGQWLFPGFLMRSVSFDESRAETKVTDLAFTAVTAVWMCPDA